MTQTTTRQVIHHQALPIFSLPGSFEKRPLRWIYLFWTMLSSAEEEPTLLDEDTTASGKRGFFEKSNLPCGDPSTGH
jgi:hypothetical protein